MQTHVTRLALRENNFDFIRFLAASLVLVSHSYPLSGRSYEFFSRWTSGLDTGGGLAVSVFFIISGFLITASFKGTQNALVYTVSRFLRIVPGLCFAVLFAMFVIGPLCTSLSLEEYFKNPGFFAYLVNISVFKLVVGLPGTFQDTPAVGLVNGSLWTLPLEAFMYFGILVFGLLRLLSIRVMAALTLALLLARLNLSAHLGYNWGNQGPHVYLNSLTTYALVRNGYWFAAGSLLYLMRPYIPVRGDVALLCFAAVVFSFGTSAAETMYFLLLPYLVYYVSFAKIPGASVFSRYGDFSYGIYIFAFPIQQTVVHYVPGIGVGSLMGISFILTLMMAVISWNFVEAPALRLKPKAKRLGQAKLAEPDAAPAVGVP